MEALRIRGTTAVICRLTFQPPKGAPRTGINYAEWMADLKILYEHEPEAIFLFGEPSLTTKFLVLHGLLSRFKMVGQYREDEGGYRILKDDARLIPNRRVVSDDELYKIAKETN